MAKPNLLSIRPGVGDSDMAAGSPNRLGYVMKHLLTFHARWRSGADCGRGLRPSGGAGERIAAGVPNACGHSRPPPRWQNTIRGEVEGKCVFVEVGELESPRNHTYPCPLIRSDEWNRNSGSSSAKAARLSSRAALAYRVGPRLAKQPGTSLGPRSSFCTARSARLLCQTSTMAHPAPMGPQPSGSLSLAVFGGERAFTG
jgi:hypothetical protein